LALAPFPPVHPLRVVLRPERDAKVPPFLGSTLHGALARALWRTVCAFPRRTTCEGCLLRSRCAYPRLFEPVAPPAAKETLPGVTDEAPRPLVLAPEAGWTRASRNAVRVAAGSELPFRVTLIGGAAEELAVVVVSLRRMAETGIGRAIDGGGAGHHFPRGRFRLLCVDLVGQPSWRVYDADTEEFRPPPRAVTVSPGESRLDAVDICLETPIRLKSGGKILGRPSPAVFLRALARRINTLGRLYGGGDCVDAAQVEDAGREIEEVANETRLVQVRRYSGRQRRVMEWPGIMGTLRWRGPGVARSWTLLRFGEIVQVGKATALGFGRFRLGSSSGLSPGANVTD
jgi:hypothetical protein